MHDPERYDAFTRKIYTNARAVIAQTGATVATYPTGRCCADPSCTTRLSRYNPATRCALHDDQSARVIPSCPIRHAEGWAKGAPIEESAALARRIVAAHRNNRHAAESLGISEDTLRKMAKGYTGRRKQVAVSARTIDRMLTRAGLQHERHNWECLA